MSQANDLLGQVRKHLETEMAFGITQLPGTDAAPKIAMPKFSGNKKEALSVLEKEYKNCVLCQLSQGRTQVVFGAGSAVAKLMFVGEAPGFDEDVQGQPFVGAAGQLLTKIIEAMKLKREDVYIANVLKCRPPNNRNPLPTEVVSCKPILEKQIDIIQPQVICALGKFAAQTLLGTEESISRLRGKFFDRNGIKVMPTFHPAYLLRNPEDKRLVWEDMQKIMKEIGLP